MKRSSLLGLRVGGSVSSGSVSGFSMVELMIVMSIVGILMLAFSGYMFQQLKANKELANAQNTTALKGGVLEASTQAEALSRSEGLQFQNLGQTPSPWPSGP